MKSLVICSSLLALASPSLGAIIRRQHGGHGAAGSTGGHGGASEVSGVENAPSSAAGSTLSPLAALLIPEKKAMKVTELTPQTKKPGTKRIRMRHGPFKLRVPGDRKNPENGKSMDPAGTAWNYRAAKDLPRDATYLFTKTNIVFEDGKRASISNGAYNHHLIITNMSKKQQKILGCRNGTTEAKAAGISILAGGAEDDNAFYYAGPEGNMDAGYYVGKYDTIMMAGDVVNYKNVSQTVYVDTELEYVKGKLAMDVQQEPIKVQHCDGKGSIIEVPEGQKQWAIKGTDIIMQHRGFFTHMAGHLHDGGVGVSMSINGKLVCDSLAVYGGEGSTMVDESGKTWETIATMKDCSGPFAIRKGDAVTLVASYDLEKHPAREQHGGMMAEEMALMGAAFAYKPE